MIKVVGNTTVFPYSAAQLRLDNPNISFPRNMSEEQLTEFGVYIVDIEPDPVFDKDTQRVLISKVPTYENGRWVLKKMVEAYTKPKYVPTVLTPRQARLALLGVGLLDEVETLLANDKAMQIWWEYSLDIQRNHEHIVTMAGALGLTEVQLDELFIEGAKL